jgi:hypothetical protein
MRLEELYLQVGQFEVTLRRVLRWELMASKGTQWLLCLDEKFDEIQNKMCLETRNGFRPSLSELSYLSLGELLYTLFDDLWDPHFKKVFVTKGFKTSLLKDIGPLRNKIAHFRELGDQEYLSFISAIHCTEKLRNYYSDSNLTEVYLSSDPHYWMEAKDPEEEEALRFVLAKHCHQDLWVEFTAFESIRVHDMNAGVGIYANHFFVEVSYQDTNRLESALHEWYIKNRFSVTFVRISTDRIRVFWSLAVHSKEVKKGLRTLQKVLTESHRHAGTAAFQSPLFADGFAVQTKSEKFIGAAF